MPAAETRQVRETLQRIGSIVALVLGPMFWPADAQAREGAKNQAVEFVASRPAGSPTLAVVSLGKQRVTIYDAEGWIMRAPVSSGRGGYETPAGIFAVIQKDADHQSNLYDDGYMPFMQRITWSGIALHGGPLPGYPASHGCVRMPVEFAERLFGLTPIGMRVIVARDDPVPIEFSHPVLASLSQGPAADASTSESADLIGLSSARPRNQLPFLATQKAAEAKAAAERAEAARLESVKQTMANSRISAALYLSKSAKSRLELQLEVVQKQIDAAASPEAKVAAEETRAKIVSNLAQAEARLNAAMAAAEHRPDVAQLREKAEAAEAESKAAAQAAEEAAQRALPISIFISRKTQRLYVRRSFQPLWDAAITFRDPDQAIGTHVFSASEYSKDGELRWKVVSLDSRFSSTTAGAALDQIIIPTGEMARISELTSPRSSLIISDEGLSSETANDTDFIIILSDEPQGGIKKRHRNRDTVYRYRYDVPYRTFFWR